MKIVNRKAYHEYFIIKEYIAGIQLQGSEVKSLRNGNCNLQDTFVLVINNEVFVKNAFISKYKESTIYNHEEKRDRKLLLLKREISQLIKGTKESGITIIPLEIFELNGKFKMKIGIAKGKKLYDKRQSIKERDINREIKKELSYK